MFWLTMRQLKSGTLNTRKKAAKDLWREPNPRALEGLTMALLTDSNVEVRQIAASALARLSVADRMEPLLKALNDKEPDVIKSAMLGLRAINDERVLHELVPLLQHQESTVRSGAAQTIDTMRWAPKDRGPRAWFSVAKGWYERAAACGPDALPALKLTIETAPISAAVRAVEALGSISDLGAIALLRSTLRSPEPAVCIAAAAALGRIGGAEAVEA